MTSPAPVPNARARIHQHRETGTWGVELMWRRRVLHHLVFPTWEAARDRAIRWTR